MAAIRRIVSSRDAASEGEGLCAWAPASIPTGWETRPSKNGHGSQGLSSRCPHYTRTPHRSRGSAPPFRAGPDTRAGQTPWPSRGSDSPAHRRGAHGHLEASAGSAAAPGDAGSPTRQRRGKRPALCVTPHRDAIQRLPIVGVMPAGLDVVPQRLVGAMGAVCRLDKGPGGRNGGTPWGMGDQSSLCSQ